MNTKILVSLSIIGVVAAVAVGGTIAYFSDTETSTGNTFTAGTIDIAVNGQNPWSETGQYQFVDMKPSQVEYSNFTINNVGTNPVNVWKKVDVGTTSGGLHPESELGEDPNDTINNIDTAITYDLSVVVKDSTSAPKWNQTLYNMNKTIAQITGQGTFLGMIPEGWSMDVVESYHMLASTTNWAQGDVMPFSITVTGEQLKGTVVLEDKDQAAPWRVRFDTPQNATFTYGVKDSKLNFTLTGISPVISGNVALVAGYDAGTNPDTLIGYGTTDANGTITMNTNSIDLGKNLISAKLWLIPKGDWNEAGHTVIGWHMSQYLWETGLFDYYDTDL